MKRFLLGALVIAAAALPASATEYTRFQTLPVAPALRAGEAADCTTMALLNLPPAWRPGDAAVVMLAPWQAPDPARDRLVSALLVEQAAVLELAPEPCPGIAPDVAGVPADPSAAALGALAALRRTAGAGLVVAIGYGPGARRMLAAVEEAEAAARLGPGGPRFAAAVLLGDGRPVFVLGAPQPAAERASARLGLLCEALGAVAAGLPEAIRSGPGATAGQCRAITAFDGLSASFRSPASPR